MVQSAPRDGAPYQWTILSIQRRSSASTPRFELGLGKIALPKFWALRFEDSAWGIAEKSECISSEEEAGETHGSGGPGWGEGPTGGRDEEAGGGGECDGIVGEG